jgi:hypothetical protein
MQLNTYHISCVLEHRPFYISLSEFGMSPHSRPVILYSVVLVLVVGTPTTAVSSDQVP